MAHPTTNQEAFLQESSPAGHQIACAAQNLVQARQVAGFKRRQVQPTPIFVAGCLAAVQQDLSAEQIVVHSFSSEQGAVIAQGDSCSLT